MAARTLSASANFDDASLAAWANGDTLTVDSGALLTFNSDNRWGQNAAVIFTTTLSATLGGNILIDARNTWWVPYDAGTGNVPALGTCGTPDVTRSGSNVAEFLGVWTALGTAPLAAGGAMPATGFIKFRTKSTTLADNDVLTFAGGATATVNSATGGQLGWIHHVSQEGVINISRLNSHTIRGGWFYLDNTNGTDGQVLQHYVADLCPMIEVETAPSSGVYDKWSGCRDGLPLALTAQLLVTGAANNGSGLIRITTAAQTLVTGDQVVISGVAGVTAANGTWTVTVISTTLVDLQGSTFAGSYTASTGVMAFNGTASTPGAIAVSGTANAAGLIRITTPRAHGLTTSNIAKIASVTGTTEANGSWIVTVIDATHFDLQGSTFVNAWVSGGSVKQTTWSAVNVATDDRGKFFLMGPTGTITFGGTTTGYGKTPASGCRVRVPNVHWSGCPAQSYGINSLNQAVTTRVRFTLAQGVIDWEYCSLSNVYPSFVNAYSVRFINCHGFDRLGIDTNVLPVEVTNSGITCLYELASGPLVISSSLAGGTFTDCVFTRSIGVVFQPAAGYSSNSANLEFIRCIWPTCQNGLISGPSFDICNSVTLTDCKFVGQASFGSCAHVRVTNSQVCSKNAGTYNLVNPKYMFSVTTCQDVVIDGVSYGFGVEIPEASGVLNLVNTSTDVRMRNIGTRAAPMDLKSNGNVVVTATGFNQRVRFSRIYHVNHRSVTSAYVTTADSDFTLTDCGEPTSYSQERHVFGWNQLTKRYSGAGGKTLGSGAGLMMNATLQSGCHFTDWEADATTSILHLQCTEKTAVEPSASAYTIDAGSVLFDGVAGALLKSTGDQITWTWGYWILGCTGFQNTAPLLSGTGTGNLAYTYDLDKGAGFSGTFKTLNAANLFAETGILPTGYRIKIRAVCVTPGATNRLSGVAVFATTSASDIAANLYEHNELYTEFTGLTVGTSIDVFNTATGKSLVDTVAVAADTTVRVRWSANFAANARLRLCGYAPIDYTFTQTENDLSFPITQVLTPIVPLTNPGALSIAVTNHGVSPVTWNGKVFSITIQDNTGYTGAQIANYIHWNIALLAAFNGFSGHAWPSMVQPNSTSFETVYGALYGSAGAALKGVRVVQADGVTPHPGFTRYQADDGTYYTPPAFITGQVTGIIAGSRLQVYNVTTATEIDNLTVVGTTWSLSYLDGSSFTTGDVIRIRVRKEGYTPQTLTAIASASGWSALAQQVVNPYFAASSPTAYTVDYGNQIIRATGARDQFTAQDLIDIISAAEATSGGIALAEFAEISGNVELSPGVFTALTVNLIDWQVSWAAGSVAQAFLLGGNIVGGVAGDPVEDVVGGPQVTIQLAQAGTVVAGSGISPTDAAAIADAVWAKILP